MKQELYKKLLVCSDINTANYWKSVCEKIELKLELKNKIRGEIVLYFNFLSLVLKEIQLLEKEYWETF